MSVNIARHFRTLREDVRSISQIYSEMRHYQRHSLSGGRMRQLASYGRNAVPVLHLEVRRPCTRIRFAVAGGSPRRRLLSRSSASPLRLLASATAGLETSMCLNDFWASPPGDIAKSGSGSASLVTMSGSRGAADARTAFSSKTAQKAPRATVRPNPIEAKDRRWELRTG